MATNQIWMSLVSQWKWGLGCGLSLLRLLSITQGITLWKIWVKWGYAFEMVGCGWLLCLVGDWVWWSAIVSALFLIFFMAGFLPALGWCCQMIVFASWCQPSWDWEVELWWCLHHPPLPFFDVMLLLCIGCFINKGSLLIDPKKKKMVRDEGLFASQWGPIILAQVCL